MYRHSVWDRVFFLLVLAAMGVLFVENTLPVTIHLAEQLIDAWVPRISAINTDPVSLLFLVVFALNVAVGVGAMFVAVSPVPVAFLTLRCLAREFMAK